MIKVLVLLLLLLFLLAILATRYRRQITMGIQIFKMFRQVRGGSTSLQDKQIPKREDLSNVPLVKCVKCGTWVPQTSALKLGGNTYYCSTACVEKSEVRV